MGIGCKKYLWFSYIYVIMNLLIIVMEYEYNVLKY